MKNRLLLPVLMGLLVVLTTVIAKQGEAGKKQQDNWPVFRGDTLQQGTSTTKLPEKLRELWKFKTGDAIEGTPAIFDEVVYIGSYDGNLYAIDLNTGKEKWRYKAAPITAPVGYHDGRVYVGDDDGIFHCIDAKVGKKIWTWEARAEITSGAAFADKKVLFGTGAESLQCLSLDGKKLWTFTVEGGPVKATPSIVGNRTFVAGCDSALHIIDINNGKEITAVELEGQVGATAAIDGNLLYVGTMTDQVLAIDWDKGKIKWTFRPQRGRQPFFASVALTKDRVYAGCRNRRFYSLDRESGKEVWNFLTRDRIESSPVVVGSHFYGASMDGNLYVLSTDKGALVQKIELDSAALGSPAVSNRRLLIGTEKGTIYCFGK